MYTIKNDSIFKTCQPITTTVRVLEINIFCNDGITTYVTYIQNTSVKTITLELFIEQLEKCNAIQVC